jgi:hypothetical protein
MKRIIFFLIVFLTFHWTLSNAEVTYPPLFGIQDNKLTYDQSLRLNAAKAGAKWVREYVLWSDIEPNEPARGTPNYNWGKYDALFRDYQNLGLTVIAVLGGIPSWAGPKSCGPILRMNDFKRFLSDLVKRYDGSQGFPKVRFYEFFNEPDLRSEVYAGKTWGFWSEGGGGRGAHYAQMLKEVYNPLKTANSNVMVVFGGLALEKIGKDAQGKDIFNFNFLDEVLEAGGGSFFDVMNFHYYANFKSVWRSYGKDILGKLAYVNSRFTTYKVEQKPVFVSEAGEWSSTLAICRSNYVRNEEIQAQYAMKLYVRGLVGDVKSVIWFILQDFDYGPGWECDSTRGLFRENGSQKPGHQAYKTVSDMLQGVSYLGVLPGVEEGYIFSKGKTRIYALWNESKERSVPFTINASRVTKVDKIGKPETIYPSSGNTYNLTVGSDPIYIVFVENIIAPQSFTVTSPNGGETWPVGTTQTIRWTYTGSPGSYVTIELLRGGMVNRTISSRAPIGSGGSGSYNWSIPSTQTPGTDYTIRVTSTSNSSYTDTSDNNFKIY